MRFDPTVNIGQLLSAVVILAAVVSAYFTLRTDIQLHDQRIGKLEELAAQQKTRGDEAVRALHDIKTNIAVLRAHIMTRDGRLDRRKNEGGTGNLQSR